MAAILFTSGGTGRPKGVVYTHKIYTEQTRLLQELFNLTDSEIDLPCFPLFSLFTLCMGMTSCIPDMNPSQPAKADPQQLIQNIMDNKVTFMAGSPAIWEALGKYCEKNKITLPSVKYLVMFGAPVRNKLHKRFSKILPNGTTYTPYGATESLPVANISGKIILEQTAALTEQGKGTCVGVPVPGVEVSIIEISDDIIENISKAKILKPYEIGEIIVKGDYCYHQLLSMHRWKQLWQRLRTMNHSGIAWETWDIRMIREDYGFADAKLTEWKLLRDYYAL